jgi:hypothetical protein
VTTPPPPQQLQLIIIIIIIIINSILVYERMTYNIIIIITWAPIYSEIKDMLNLMQNSLDGGLARPMTSTYQKRTQKSA